MATMHAFCRDDFTRFADFCFRTYGDRVKNWFTINEPRMMASHGYGDGYFPPARCTGCHFGGNSATEPYIAGHNLLLAHASAVKLYREKYQACDLPGTRITLTFSFGFFQLAPCSPLFLGELVSGPTGWQDRHPARLRLV